MSRIAEIVASTFLLVLLLGGCTKAAYRWANDEVTPEELMVGDSDSTAVHVRVKNIEERDDGLYAVVLPRDWKTRPRVNHADGTTSLLELLPDSAFVRSIWPAPDLSLRGLFWPNRSVPGLVTLDRRDVMDSEPSGAGDGIYGLVVEREDDRRYTIQVYGSDAEAHKWILLSETPVGKGTQSPLRKPMAIAATPVTIVLDGVLFVLVLVGGAFGAMVPPGSF